MYKFEKSILCVLYEWPLDTHCCFFPFIVRKGTTREREKSWKEAKWQRARLLNKSKNTSKSVHLTQPVIAGEDFTKDELPQSCYLFLFSENQNDFPESIQLNQNLHERRQDCILDVDRSNAPLVKRPCLEKSLENLSQEMSAPGTLTPETEDGASAGSTCGPGLVQSRMKANKPKLTAAIGACSTQKATTENEAVIPTPPLQKHTRSKKSTRKVNRAASQSGQGTSR